MELVGRSSRTTVATMYYVVWVVGLSGITGIAYIAKEPRDIELAVAACTAAHLVILW